MRAKLIAAMEAQAFVEPDVDRLLETGLRFVPGDSTIRRVVEDVRDWYAGDNAKDWRSTRKRIAETYGYDKFHGNCHVVPNHALVIMAMLYGARQFPGGDVDRQHRWLGHRLQRWEHWLLVRHQGRSGGDRRRAGLARPGR